MDLSVPYKGLSTYVWWFERQQQSCGLDKDATTSKLFPPVTLSPSLGRPDILAPKEIGVGSEPTPISLLAPLVLAVAAWIACAVWRRHNRPPRLPGSLPLLGHTYIALWGSAQGIWDIIENLGMGLVSLKIGGVGFTTFGPQRVYLITDPEDTRTVLNMCLEKDMTYHLAGPWFRKGLFLRPFDGYMARRKVMLPGVSQKALDGFYEIIDGQAAILTDSLNKFAGKGPFNMHTPLATFTLKTFLMNQLGMTEDDTDILKDKMSALVTATQAMLELVMEKFVRFWCHVPWMYRWTEIWKREQRLLESLHGLSPEIVKRRMLTLKENSDFEHVNEKSGAHKSTVLLDLLLEQVEKGVMDLSQVQEEIDTLVFAGHDTTAGSLMYTCVLLGAHPEVQETLHAELMDVLGKSEHVTKQHLSRLKYTEAVLKEAMRLYPVVPILARHVDKDVKLKKYTLHAGAKAILMPYCMQRNSAAWRDADQFQPARWLTTLADTDSCRLAREMATSTDGDPCRPAHEMAKPTNADADDVSSYMPFSWGLRACIGKQYAMALMKVTLAHMARRYRFEAAPPPRLRYRIVLQPVCEQHLSIERR